MPYTTDLASVENAFKILNIDATDDKYLIKKAAITLLRQHHPDKSKSENTNAISAQINNARDILDDLSQSELHRFVAEIQEKKAQTTTSPVLTRHQNLPRKITNPVKLPLFIGIHKAALVFTPSDTAYNFFKHSLACSNTALRNNLDISFYKTHPLKAKTLLVGQSNDSKSAFYQHAYRDPDITSMIGTDFKIHKCENISHTIYNNTFQARFRTIYEAMLKESNLVFFFDNDAGLFFDWLQQFKAHPNEFQLMSVTCIDNQIHLEPYDIATDMLKLGDINLNTNVEEIIEKAQLPEPHVVSLDQLKPIVNDLYLQLNQILRVNSSLKMSGFRDIILAPQESTNNKGCSIS